MRKKIEAIIHTRVNTKDNKGNRNGWLLEIASERGNATPHLTGQIYLTIAERGAFKGYHLHALADYSVTCIKGRIEQTIYHNRHRKDVIRMGDGDFKTVNLPRGLPHGIRNIGSGPAYVLIYRWPAWDPRIKEQLDLAPRDIEKPEIWKQIKTFLSSFATGGKSKK